MKQQNNKTHIIPAFLLLEKQETPSLLLSIEYDKGRLVLVHPRSVGCVRLLHVSFDLRKNQKQDLKVRFSRDNLGLKCSVNLCHNSHLSVSGVTHRLDISEGFSNLHVARPETLLHRVSCGLFINCPFIQLGWCAYVFPHYTATCFFFSSFDPWTTCVLIRAE